MTKIFYEILEAFLLLFSDKGTINPEAIKFANINELAGAKEIWNHIFILAIGMTIVYFLLEINRRFAFEGNDVTLKTIGVPFFKLALAVIILSRGAEIAVGVLSAGNGLIDFAVNQSSGFTAGMANVFDDNIASNAKAQEMMTLLESTDPSFNSLSVEIGERVCSGLSFIGVVIVSFVLILMFLVQKICNIVWYYKAIMYKLEWIFRLAFTPIAFSDIYSGQNSRAISWFKGLIGMALYGMGFILLPAIGNGMAITHLASVIGNFQTGTDNGVWALIGSLLTCLVYPIATIGCLSAVRQVTKEVTA